MRPHSVTSTIENGFVYVPEEAEWLEEYLHDLTTFPNGKYDDQADSTSQALEWVKRRPLTFGVFEYYERQAMTYRRFNEHSQSEHIAVNPKDWPKNQMG